MTDDTRLFAALAQLAREQLDLVTSRRFDALAELDARRARLVPLLPATASPEALPHLREALQLQSLITHALGEAKADVAAKMGAIRHKRRGAAGYVSAAGGATQRVHVDLAG